MSHVWALAWDKAQDRALRRDGRRRKGRPRRRSTASLASTSRATEPNLVSLAVADDGDVYAGSQGKGAPLPHHGARPRERRLRLPRRRSEGRSRSARTAPIYAIANEYGEPPEVPHRSPALGRTPAGGPTTAPRPKPGKGVALPLRRASSAPRR